MTNRDADGRRLSLPRVSLAVALVVMLAVALVVTLPAGGGGEVGARDARRAQPVPAEGDAGPARTPPAEGDAVPTQPAPAGGDAVPAQPAPAETWYAPYVDVTLTPRYPFEDPDTNPAGDLVLAFVVADEQDGCTPSWGAAYGLDGAATALDLDRRIARYRERGGDVVVSFGGIANDELAVTCTDVDRLATAYRSVVERYDVTTIDLDIEGGALGDAAANTRRAQAVARVQRAARSDGRPLRVWLTLPVTPDGLLGDGIAAIDAMLAADVDLGGVNVMTMNYGSTRPEATSMADATAQALSATHRQLGAAYRRAGARLDDRQLWGKVGATPMIGQNDEPTDVFGLDDAGALRAFAFEKGLGRVSMWSANRDAPCPADAGRGPSSGCSGIAQTTLDFSRIFEVATGRPAGTAPRPTGVDDEP